MRLLLASYVLPITAEPIRDGAVLTDGGKIVAVGRRRDLLKNFPKEPKEELGDVALMPGLVNCDTHLESLSFNGTGREPNLIDWILARLEHRQTLTAIARRTNLTDGVRKLLRAGTTCVGDVGDYSEVLPLLSDLPIRMTLFPEILTSAEADVGERYQGSLSLVEKIQGGRSPRLAAGIAPYSGFTLSRHLLKVIARQAALLGAPIKVHAAESFAEMQFFFESGGEIVERLFPKLGWVESIPTPHRKTPVEYLESIGLLEKGPILVGCLHLSDRDLKILSKTGSKVVWSPRSQEYLKLGKAPIAKLRKAKIVVGLGTNGTGSVHSLSLWDEMRQGLSMARPEELLRMATWQGASVLGREGEIGSLEGGKRADLVAVKIPSLLTRASPALPLLAKHLIENTTEKEIAAVWIDGERIER